MEKPTIPLGLTTGPTGLKLSWLAQGSSLWEAHASRCTGRARPARARCTRRAVTVASACDVTWSYTAQRRLIGDEVFTSLIYTYPPTSRDNKT
jgi:hypothetical protein